MRSFALVAVVLVGCYSSQPAKPAVPKGAWGGFEVLANIPADSPYVFAILDTPADGIRDRLWASADRKVVALLNEATATPPETRAAAAPIARALYGIVDALHGKDPQLWAENLGLKRNGHWLWYGLGIWPVMRWELANPAKLRSILATAAKTSGLSVHEKQAANVPYWQLDQAGISIIVSVSETDAVLAALPTATLAQTLPVALGQKPVARSLKDSGEASAILAKHHFTPAMLAYIDSHRVVASLERTDELATTSLFKVPGCHPDYERIAAAVPRFVFGYRKLDVRGFDAAFAMELAPELANALSALQTAMPATPDLQHALMSFTVATNLDGLLATARGWLQQLADHPFACPQLAGTKALVDDALEHSKTLIPKTYAGLEGGQVVVEDATQEPPAGSGYVLVTGSQIATTVAELLSKSGLGLKLAPDGNALALPVALVMPSLKSAHIAMNPNRAVVAVGERSKQQVSDVLAAPKAAHTPLASMTWDLEKTRKQIPKLIKGDANEKLEAYASVFMTLDVTDESLVLDVSGVWLK